MSKPAPQPASPAHYNLYLRDGRKKFFFRYHDEGIVLDDKGLACTLYGIEQKQPYENIVSVRLQMTSIPKSDALYTCTIGFRDGRQIAIANASKYGSAEDQRTVLYGQFVRDLHKRIPKPERSRIRFYAGNTESQQRILIATLVIAGLFFVGLPLALLLYIQKLEVLGVLLTGAAFIYPLWRSANANEPRTYHSKYLPDELVPAVSR